MWDFWNSISMVLPADKLEKDNNFEPATVTKDFFPKNMLEQNLYSFSSSAELVWLFHWRCAERNQKIVYEGLLL